MTAAGVIVTAADRPGVSTPVDLVTALALIRAFGEIESTPPGQLNAIVDRAKNAIEKRQVGPPP